MVEYQKTDKLTEKAATVSTQIALLYIGIGISILSIFVFINLNQSAFAIFGFIFAMLCIGLTRSKRQYKNIILHGLKGEKVLKKTIKKALPDNYTAFYNVSFNGSGDVDCIVVGPSGIYILEAKHHKGQIEYSKNGWRHIKTSRIGKQYYNDNFRDPVKEVNWHIFKTKKFFSDNGIDVWIKGVVVFTHPDVQLSLLRKPSTQVITIDKVKSIFNGNNAVTGQRQKGEIEKIRRLLEKL